MNNCQKALIRELFVVYCRSLCPVVELRNLFSARFAFFAVLTCEASSFYFRLFYFVFEVSLPGMQEKKRKDKTTSLPELTTSVTQILVANG